MPQDIPLEASDRLAFTPPALAEIDNPPVFQLRAATWREKRFQRRLVREERLVTHDTEEIREAVEEGLRKHWTAEQFEQYFPRLQSYWQAQDYFAAVRSSDAEAVWEYDPEDERLCNQLIERIARAERRLGEIIADRAEAQEMRDAIIVAIIVVNWDGLDVTRSLDRGYISLDSVFAIKDALSKREFDADLETGEAWDELVRACELRTVLSAEESANFISPSPSAKNPEPSSETATSEADGTSPAPAPSKKTRKRA